jgi:hypothetical protein
LSAGARDPWAEKQATSAQARREAADTFRDTAEEWLDKRRRKGIAEVTLDKAKWPLSFVDPTIGETKVSSIRRFELAERQPATFAIRFHIAAADYAPDVRGERLGSAYVKKLTA